MVCRHRRRQPASSARSELVLQPREEAKRSEMSLSNKQPASLSEYSQLCKSKNTESFSEAFHCMESPKDFGKTEFEWQRTEGKLNEIGLNVNSGGPIKDGLVKNAGFTDEDKLCFFEGKRDKELKIAQKDKREIEVQGKKYQAAAGHLESWSLISETFPSAEGNFANPKATDFHVGQAGAEKSGPGLGKNGAITDQEKAAGKAGMETKCQPDPNLPNLSVSESDPSKYMKEQEISVWNPNFHPILPNNSGSKEATVKKDGAPSYCVIGVVNDNYVQSGFSSSSMASKPEPPTTTVELAQDDSKSSDFNNTTEMEEEMEDKLSCGDDGSFLNRAAHQRKAMRRAMSECSHLSVPLTLNLADKYPEPVLREDVATGLLSPNSSLTQCSSPTARKPGAPMKRSMTVSEEQTSVCSLGPEQSRAGLPSLVVKEHQSLLAEEPAAKKREEWNSGSNSVKKELGSPGLYHSKLEQIPEISSQDKEREEEAVKREKRNATDGAAGFDSPKSKCTEMESSKTAPLERKEIEVSDVQSSPSPKQGDLPRDGMLLIFTSLGSEQTVARKELTDLTGCRQRVGGSVHLKRPTLFRFRPPLHHVPEHLIHTAFKYPQGWGLHHCPGQPGPVLDNPFGEVKFPHIQSKPPLAQLEAISSRPAVVESDEVSPQPPFLQAEQPQVPQPLPISLVLQTLPQLRCPSLDTLQPLNVSLVVRGPTLNTAFEVRPHQCRAQGHGHCPAPAGHTIADTSQDAVGFLGHLGTLPAHVQAAVDQHPQVLFLRAALQPLFPKPVALHGVAVAQVQDPALSLVEPRTIGPSPWIQPVQIPLQSLPPLQQINPPAQLGVICKLTEGARDPFVQIIDKDIKQDWPQHRALGTPLVTGHQLDLTPFTTALWARPSSQFFTQRRAHPSSHEQPVSPGECCGKPCQRLY
ncbi:hypothetical protein QYF61_001526 [Mycteria americana]|uniref:Uncharacterized protein n=1 Tax=Mycteria americana TaxID=33587 RepID=A0AAN7ND90_MYCAM|nr:hypothetical protein QYF61_001526 [Mycteria americana]